MVTYLLLRLDWDERGMELPVARILLEVFYPGRIGKTSGTFGCLRQFSEERHAMRMTKRFLCFYASPE